LNLLFGEKGIDESFDQVFIFLYLFIGIPSTFDLIRGSNYQEHRDFYTEQRADKWAEIWFGKNYVGK